MSDLDLFSRWRPELFRPKRQYAEITQVFDGMKKKLDEQAIKRYSSCFRRFLCGWQTDVEFLSEVTQILPESLMAAHHQLHTYVTNTCFITDPRPPRILADNSKPATKATEFLPDAFTITALLLQATIERGIPIGDDLGKAGGKINSVLRTILKDRIEGAVRVQRTHAVADHGFLKYFGQKPSAQKSARPAADCPPLSAREFLDSAVLTDWRHEGELNRQLENCESHVNFFYRMLTAVHPELAEAAQESVQNQE